MKRLALLLCFTVAATAGASDTYVYKSGYWVANGNAYTRTLYQAPGYWSCGYYYQPVATYQYVYSHAYVAPAATVYPTAKDTGWRSRLLDLAGQRDKAQALLNKEALEQKNYIEAINALGLNGILANAYPYAAAYTPGAGYASLQLSSQGVQGSTVFGYSTSSLANLYGANDLTVLYQQANRLAASAQASGAAATKDFASLVSQEGDNRARVAEILAKGQVTQEYLRALNGPPTSTTKTATFTVGAGPDGQIQVQPVPGQQPMQPTASAFDLKAWQSSAARCLTCHSGKRTEGGFDVTQYPSLTPEQKLSVFGRLVHPDDAKRMPRGTDGKAGPRLSPGELRLWLSN